METSTILEHLDEALVLRQNCAREWRVTERAPVIIL